MYSVYKLNKQDDSLQPSGIPFPTWNQSVVACTVLTVASWPAYRFLRRQVRWSGLPISWRIFHNFVVIRTVKGFGIVNKAEIVVFLELSCFFDDPVDVGSLISGSSVFSKTSLNIWKFTVYVLLKPGLENFEHYFTSMWDGNIKNTNIHIIKLSEGKEWEGAKNIFEEIVATNYPNLKKETEAWRIENGMNVYRSRPKRIMKMEKLKERI